MYVTSVSNSVREAKTVETNSFYCNLAFDDGIKHPHYGAFVNSTDPSRIAEHTYDTRISTYVVILYRVLIFFN